MIYIPKLTFVKTGVCSPTLWHHETFHWIRFGSWDLAWTWPQTPVTTEKYPQRKRVHDFLSKIGSKVGNDAGMFQNIWNYHEVKIFKNLNLEHFLRSEAYNWHGPTQKTQRTNTIDREIQPKMICVPKNTFMKFGGCSPTIWHHETFHLIRFGSWDLAWT